MRLLLPASRPRLSTAELQARLAPFAIDRELHPVILVGIRGYYKSSMGAPGVNDRGIYDDALFVDSPDVTAAFNGNTDPSTYRKGTGTGATKGMASLNPGVWYAHKFGRHKNKYPALVQLKGPVSVTRDGDPPYQHAGWFGINIHKGGYSQTSSEGCQTIHPDQWLAFYALAEDQAKRYHKERWCCVTIPYALLVE